MLPIWDDVPAQRRPFVNYFVIAACAFAFSLQLKTPEGNQQIVQDYGMIPVRITQPAIQSAVIEGRDESGRRVRREISLDSPVPPLVTLLTCMFLHGSWMHIIGNMWFLFIFGDNVEDRFGHVRYLSMYVVSGIMAGVLHIAADSDSAIPTIGASGAIAGVMGSYLILFPHASVMTLIPLGPFLRFQLIPSYIFLAFWFVIQIVSGLQMSAAMGGVAWWAHVGGFVCGLVITILVRMMGGLKPPIKPRRVYGFPRRGEGW